MPLVAGDVDYESAAASAGVRGVPQLQASLPAGGLCPLTTHCNVAVFSLFLGRGHLIFTPSCGSWNNPTDACRRLEFGTGAVTVADRAAGFGTCVLSACSRREEQRSCRKATRFNVPGRGIDAGRGGRLQGVGNGPKKAAFPDRTDPPVDHVIVVD